MGDLGPAGAGVALIAAVTDQNAVGQPLGMTVGRRLRIVVACWPAGTQCYTEKDGGRAGAWSMGDLSDGLRRTTHEVVDQCQSTISISGAVGGGKCLLYCEGASFESDVKEDDE